MKYLAKIYARAFSEAAGEKASGEKQKEMVRNLLSLVGKNNDGFQLKKILSQAEELIRKKSGKRKVIIETAREMSKKMEYTLGRVAGRNDLAERKINPDLVAGLKLIIDGEKQYDGSLRKKLKQLF